MSALVIIINQLGAAFVLTFQLASILNGIYRRRRREFIPLMTQNSNNSIKTRKSWKKAKKDRYFGLDLVEPVPGGTIFS